MQGEERAWDCLSGLDSSDVCRRSLAILSPSGDGYVLDLFGCPVTVAPERRVISGSCADSEWLLTKMAYFSHLAILHYLIGAQAIPLSGRLIRTSDLKAGPIYYQGSHTLPLDALAARYATNAEAFLAQGIRFGGSRQPYGDAALVLVPFPRIPVTFVLWREDEEFAARADLLFDASCEQHVPADILWSIAVLAVKVMLRERKEAYDHAR